MKNQLVRTNETVIDIIGSCGEDVVAVTYENTALSVGSGSLEVFATPMMTALMESAAVKAIREFLDDGETTVGTALSISHVSASAVGMEITAKATVTEVNGREISYKVEAYDNAGLIGEGTHKRFVVNAKKFQDKANAKV